MAIKKTESKKEEIINPIPDRVLSWYTIEGFLELYYEYAQNTSTYKAAYELAEKDYMKAYKRRRYMDYENFIKSKYYYSRRLLKRKKKERERKAAQLNK